MNTIDKLADMCAATAGKCAKATGDIVAGGKKKMDIIAIENHIAKAERQLGALVYSLHKSGEKNTLLVKRYLDNITSLDKELSALKGEQCEETYATEHRCNVCGAEVSEDALFCNSCGGKL